VLRRPIETAPFLGRNLSPTQGIGDRGERFRVGQRMDPVNEKNRYRY
jgi:hypothetical protein